MKQTERSRRIPDLTPEQQVLLLCARVGTTRQQGEALRELGSRVTRWEELCGSTVPHRLSSLTYTHLKQQLEGELPELAKQNLQRLSRWQAFSYLKIAGAQKKLNEEILQPSQIPHVFFKGIGLAEEYYPVPSYRPCRDIDVWVHPDGMGELWKRMDAAGYQRLKKPDRSHEIPAHHAAYLLPTIDVLSPDGTLIEIHTRFDHSGLTLDADKIHVRSKTIDISSGRLRVPCLEDHFIYICQHHTRHLWARLRWFVDLDAFEKYPGFSRSAVLEHARTTHLGRTVEACFDLYDGLQDPGRWRVPCASSTGQDLKIWVFNAVVSGPDELNEAARDRRSPDFALRWQYSWWYIVLVRLQRLKPTQADYLAAPLERRQWWLYYLARPFRLIRQYFARSSEFRVE